MQLLFPKAAGGGGNRQARPPGAGKPPQTTLGDVSARRERESRCKPGGVWYNQTINGKGGLAVEKGSASRVSVVPCGDYEAATVRRALETALEEAGGLDWVRPGMRVGIKLNLCAALRPEKAATTHPVMAAELTRLLRARGAQVVLGDSPGEPFTAVVLNRIYGATGMKLAEEAGGELNRDFSHVTVEVPQGKTLRSFGYSSWLAGCDEVINFCKLKSHGLFGMTAAVKNLYGVVPGTMKSEYHFRYSDPMKFAHMLVDLNEYVRPRLCLCDAVDIMEGNGPTQGTVRPLGLLLAGRDPYAMDRLCAWLLGLREEEILYLTAARQRGLLVEEGAPEEAWSQYRLEDFRRSGATASWFVSNPQDGPGRKLMKKAMTVLFRSRPALGEGCTGCGACARLCPAGAIQIQNRRAVIHRKKCVRCFCCQEFCPSGAMQVHRTLVARLLERDR